MPIYEFYCTNCNMIFNFLSKSVNTEKRPSCPKCQKTRLERRMSVFATPQKRDEEGDMPLPDLDEGKMEKAMNLLAREAEHINEDDPRQAADLMRKLGEEPFGIKEKLSKLSKTHPPKVDEKLYEF